MILDYRRYNGFKLEIKEERCLWDTFDLTQFIGLYSLLKNKYDKIEIIDNNYIVIYNPDYTEIYRLKKVGE